MVLIQATAVLLRYSRIRMGSSQSYKGQYPDIRRMVGLPHVLVGDSLANFEKVMKTR
jgi:hypothetical protein